MFIFSLVFVSFLIYIGCHNICVLIKRQTQTYFYKIPELLIRWVFFSDYFLEHSIQYYNITTSTRHSLDHFWWQSIAHNVLISLS